MKKVFLAAAIALAAITNSFSQEISCSLKLEQAVSADFSSSHFTSIDFGGSSSTSLALKMSQGAFSMEGSGAGTVLFGTSAKNLLAAKALGKNQFLEIIIPDLPDILLDFRLSAFFASFASGNVKVEAGLSQINWGTGKIFSPADIFAHYRRVGLSIEREADILLRAFWYSGPTSIAEAVFVPYLPYPNEKSGLAFGTRFYTALFDTIGAGLQAAWFSAHGLEPASAAVAIEAQTDLWFFTPRVEAKLAIPFDAAQHPAWQMMAGLTIPFGSVSVFAEYLYDPAGAFHHSVYASLSLKADDWLMLSLPVFLYPGNGFFQGGISAAGVQLLGAQMTCSALIGHLSPGTFNIQILAYLTKKF